MKTPWEVVEQIAHFKAYVPGLSMEEIANKYQLKNVVKMASNENPFGVSEKVAACICENAKNAFRYPQGGNPRLVQKLAKYFSQKYPYISEKNIFVGNGSDEIIDLLFRVRCKPNEHNVVTFDPCFGIYVTQANFHECELRQAKLNDDLTFNFERLLNLVDEKTSMVFVTSPDNPSGRLARKKDLISLAHMLPQGCLLVVDEAYIEFASPNPQMGIETEADISLISEFETMPNIAITRTFSKIYGLAGLRVGYAILPEQLANYLWRVRLPFSLNILAQEAACVALDDEDFVKKTNNANYVERNNMFEKLSALGFDVIPSSSNFLMFSMPKDSRLSAKDFCTELLEKGFILRHLASYGFPEHLRVSIGKEKENKSFLSLCKKILKDA